MVDTGITLVRIAEFAWSRVEPARDQFDWAWLDQAVDVLFSAGLQVIMCTPTACPPKWLVDELPDILPVDAAGRVRGFGSRRHYRFASSAYRTEAQRISQAVIERYAQHPAVTGWQTDNEYGCHETTLSYAQDDLAKFREWLRSRHASIAALNSAWGTVFWSQEYRDFDSIELPNLTVTEANPAHQFAYRQFASEQVAAFNADQVCLIREHCPTSHWITHNFMGNFTEFDHFDVGQDLDIATWDSYPLGFLDQGWFTEQEKLRYRRVGHPDWAAFHHDLYRAVGNGRFGVMEQQPGPVNWATHNAQPLPGMARFWAWEAIAHGAEFVSFFRWQQAPFAQEQMHAALRLPDGDEAPASASVRLLSDELETLGAETVQAAPVALLFDYRACWTTDIQPHSGNYSALEASFTAYSALRALGLDIDIVSQTSDLDAYALIVIPCAPMLDAQFIKRLEHCGAHIVIGPRSGSRTNEFSIPANLAPGPLQALLPAKVIAIDAIRPGATRTVESAEHRFHITRWYEELETALLPAMSGDDDTGFWYQHERYHYLNGWLEADDLSQVFRSICEAAGIATIPLAKGLRTRRRGQLTCVFNFSKQQATWRAAGARLLIGDENLSQGELAVWYHSDG